MCVTPNEHFRWKTKSPISKLKVILTIQADVSKYKHTANCPAIITRGGGGDKVKLLVLNSNYTLEP